MTSLNSSWRSLGSAMSGAQPWFYRSSSFKFISLSGFLAAHYPANQGQALLAHLTDIGDESESDAGQGFAGQLAIEFARPCRYLIAMLRRA